MTLQIVPVPGYPPYPDVGTWYDLTYEGGPEIYCSDQLVCAARELNPARTYRFSVRLHTLKGNGPWSELSAPALPFPPPSKPKVPYLVTVGVGQVYVSWSKDVYGTPIDAVVFECSNGATDSSGGIAVVFAGLDSGTEYSFRVTTSNAYGSTSSDWVSIVAY